MVMAKRRVLIADDDQVVRLFLFEVLGKVLGFEVEEATTVSEAARKTVSGKYDLVLVDRHLADGTLEDYCAALTKDGGGLDVPKWVVTGEKPLEWDDSRMQACGIRGYLVKPCRIDELKAALETVFPGGSKWTK